MPSYDLDISDSPRNLSPEFAYELEFGDTLYYGSDSTVSASNNEGSLAPGDILDAATAAGGGRVHFPLGTYLITEQGTDFGVPWMLHVEGDNIHLDFEPGAVLKTEDASTAAMIFAAGASKPDGPENWSDYYLGDATATTYYGMNAVLVASSGLDLAGSAGARSITSSHWGSFVGIFNSTVRSMKAYYTYSGADPTTGVARIVVPFVRLPEAT